MFSYRKPRRASKLFFLLVITALCNCFIFALLLELQTVPADFEGRSRGTNTLQEAFWLDEHTRRFTKLWRDHKTRNVIIYVCLLTRKIPLLSWAVYELFGCPQTLYSPLFDTLFQVPTACFSHSCLQSFGQSHYIYSTFILQTYDSVMAFDISPPPPTSRGKVAVLVEPRYHPLYEYTVKQVMHCLGNDWSLQLFVSTENAAFVKEAFEIWSGGAGEHVVVSHLRELGLDDMGKLGNRVQSAFSAHQMLYESIVSEHVLWFQLDVIMRGPLPPEWLDYAYIGSEWNGCQYPLCSSCKNICGGGNSGLSFRRKSKLLLVATEGSLPQDLWGKQRLVNSTSPNMFESKDAVFASDALHENSRDHWFEDDLQISYKLEKLGLLPPPSVPPRFAISQALPSEGLAKVDPKGMHKPWATPWFPPEVIVELLDQPFKQIHREGSQ